MMLIVIFDGANTVIVVSPAKQCIREGVYYTVVLYTCTLAVAICPSLSIRSIVPVGKYGMMK